MQKIWHGISLVWLVWATYLKCVWLVWLWQTLLGSERQAALAAPATRSLAIWISLWSLSQPHVLVKVKASNGTLRHDQKDLVRIFVFNWNHFFISGVFEEFSLSPSLSSWHFVWLKLHAILVCRSELPNLDEDGLLATWWNFNPEISSGKGTVLQVSKMAGIAWTLSYCSEQFVITCNYLLHLVTDDLGNIDTMST